MRRVHRVRVCPVCGSKNIRLFTKLSGWLTPEIYVCEDCGYKGPITLEIEINEKDVQ